MSAALLIDFGSTYTKLRAVDLERRRIIGSGQGPSTVATDITIGMKAALDDLERHCGGVRGGWKNLKAVIPGGSSVPMLTAVCSRSVIPARGARKTGG